MKRSFKTGPKGNRAIQAASRDRLPKGYPIMYDKQRDDFYAVYEGHELHHSDHEELARMLNELNEHPDKLSEYAAICSADDINSSGGRSRVIAIQVDVELPAGVDAQVVIDDIYNAADGTVQNYHIASCDVAGDVTTQYEDNYPDLLVYREE